MKEFSYLNYHTEYSCEGTVNIGMNVHACFSYVWNSQHMNNEYSIVLYTNLDYVAEKRQNNYCPFTIKQIRNYINLLKSVFPINFSISSEENRVIIKLKIDGLGIYHKYALTWIRYLYEFPYNFILMDSYKLKSERMFMFTSIANLFNIVASAYEIDPLHSITEGRLKFPLTIKELRNRLNAVNSLNLIYISSDKRGFHIDYSEIENIEYWCDENYVFRRNVYLNNYELLKN